MTGPGGFCKRGHPRDKAVTRWQVHENGRAYRACRACQRLCARLRYRNDDNYREKEKQRTLANYYARTGRGEAQADGAAP